MHKKLHHFEMLTQSLNHSHRIFSDSCIKILNEFDRKTNNFKFYANRYISSLSLFLSLSIFLFKSIEKCFFFSAYCALYPFCVRVFNANGIAWLPPINHQITKRQINQIKY